MEVTKVSDYNKKAEETQMLECPEDGLVVEIYKKVSARKLVTKYLPLITDISKNAAEKAEARMAKMTEKQIDESAELNDLMIIKAVKSPAFSLVKEEGKICLDDISDANYTFLSEQTSKISYGKNVTDPLE